MERVDEALGNFSASCKFRMVSIGVEWAFSGVYGPYNSTDRGLLWEELSGVHGWWEVISMLFAILLNVWVLCS